MIDLSTRDKRRAARRAGDLASLLRNKPNREIQIEEYQIVDVPQGRTTALCARGRNRKRTG
jgi:hypothetical protein